MFLLSSAGEIVSSYDSEYKGKTLRDFAFAAADLAAMEKSLASRESVLRETRSPFFGETSLIYVVPVVSLDMEYGLFLYLDSPVSILYGDSGTVIGTIILVFLVGLAVIIITALLATNNIVKPLLRITGYAESISKGNREVSPDQLGVDGKGGREVAVLGESIQKMLEHMNQNHQLKLIAMEAEFEKQKVEEASHARTQFFANMSHELRTPMNAIVGISDILLAEDMQERHLKYVRDIKMSSESLLVIIDDILDISKIESGKLKLVDSHFSLFRMLGNVSSMATYLAREKDLEFIMSRDDGVPEYVYGDEVRIRQIILNLIGNAVKFTQKGTVRLNAFAEAGNLCFDVVDTGIGIRKEDKAHLFDAFRQVDTTRNRNVKGAGLGLSITMNLVKLMGGSIEVESEYGVGSAFKIRFPLMHGDAELADLPEEAAEGEIMTSARVLVVDDNAINLKVANGMLALFGLHPNTAISGKKAIDMVTAREYDLILMDHMMPEMDGVETTRRIRAMGGRFASVPIVAFTANTLAGAESLLSEAGMNDFLAKPIRKAALQKILVKWLPAEQKKGRTVLRARSAPSLDPLLLAKGIEGLDASKGMANAGQDRELYLETVRLARKGIADGLETLETSKEPRQLKTAVHDLAATLSAAGGVELAEWALRLAASLSAGDVTVYGNEVAKFAAALRKFNAALRDLPL